MSELLYNTLELCLRELENGADIESVLARHPQIADELRPILHASMAARGMAGAEPSPDAVRRGRARLLQRAAEMREAKAAPLKRKASLLPRLAISFALVMMFFMISGAGMLNASADALPGERLYAIKRSVENVRLMLARDPDVRAALETRFYFERYAEVTALLNENRVADVQFAGIFTRINNRMYVAGIPLIIMDEMAEMEDLKNGSTVLVMGRTNTAGAVDVFSFESLPAGVVVPLGKPIIVQAGEKLIDDLNRRELPVADDDGVNDNENQNGDANLNTNGNQNANDNSNTNDDNDGGNDNDDDYDDGNDDNDDDDGEDNDNDD